MSVKVDQAQRSETEPRDLAERLRRGKASALQDAIAIYSRRLHRLAWRLLGWRGDVEDVVQDVFVAMIENAHKFRGESQVGTWLVRVTINRCRRERRRRMLRRLLPWHSSFEASKTELAAEQPLGNADRAQLVHDALRKLPSKSQEVLVLRYLEGMDLDQVAQVLGASRGAVDVRLHRARAAVAKIMNQDVEHER